MGQVLACASALNSGIRLKVPDENGAPQEAPKFSGTQTHVIIVAIDYKGTENQLTCTVDGDNFQELCRSSGVTDVVSLYDNDGNYDRVAQAIQQVGSRCGAGDFFIFYYSGHGASVADQNNDEDDGNDEALCLVSPDGELDYSTCMTDDQFAELVKTNVTDDVNVMILTDCCHSGTIADFGTSDWGGHKAVSITGCTDEQTSGDTGNGGIFTHSMLMAIADLAEQGIEDYSCAELYNLTLDKDDEVFASEQDISCAWTNACGSSSQMAWPLIPEPGYQAPWQ